MNQAVLIHHPKDMETVKSVLGESIQLVAHESYLPVLVGVEDMPTFFSLFPEDSNAYDEVSYLANSWYRDEQGKDLSYEDGMSWAQVISGSLLFTLAALYREYHALKRWLDKVDKLYVSTNEHEFFQVLVPVFAGKVEFYDPGHRSNSILSSCNDRILGGFPEASRLNSLMSFIQKPLLPFLKRKDLFFNDWTSSGQVRKRRDSLLINGGINILKSVYLNHGDKDQAERIVPKRLKPPVDTESLQKVLLGIGASWDEALLGVVEGHIQDKFFKNRAYFVKVYSIYRCLFDTYQPARAIFPGETFEPYIIALQMARYRKIETIFLGDGIASTVCVTKDNGSPLHFRDVNNRNFLFDRVITAGKSNYDYYRRSGYDAASLMLVTPPLLSEHRKVPPSPACFDVMIMSLISNDLNPGGNNGSRIKSLVEMLSAVRAAGFKRVAIKIKHVSELEWVQPVLNKTGMNSDCEIVSGMFYEHVTKARLIVGGFSTGVAEAAYHNIPYVVYEPFENGYTEEAIRSSLIVDPLRVARTPAQLKILLEKGESSVVADFAYIFDGEDLSEIIF